MVCNRRRSDGVEQRSNDWHQNMARRSDRWASDPLGDSPVEVMTKVLESMCVGLIAATPVECCKERDCISEVIERDTLSDFDHIPVKGKHGIIGVVDRKKLRTVPVASTDLVRDLMTPLAENMLLAADASIVEFVKHADLRPFALVVEKQDIKGIVTLSDLQKLAVRPTLFSLLTLVEMLLDEWVLLNFQDDDAWLKLLSEERQSEIRIAFTKLRKKNLVVNMITATEFNDKITVATQMAHFPGGANAKNELHAIRQLRNSLSHHHLFGQDPVAATNVARKVQIADKYIHLLNNCMTS